MVVSSATSGGGGVTPRIERRLLRCHNGTSTTGPERPFPFSLFPFRSRNNPKRCSEQHSERRGCSSHSMWRDSPRVRDTPSCRTRRAPCPFLASALSAHDTIPAHTAPLPQGRVGADGGVSSHSPTTVVSSSLSSCLPFQCAILRVLFLAVLAPSRRRGRSWSVLKAHTYLVALLSTHLSGREHTHAHTHAHTRTHKTLLARSPPSTKTCGPRPPAVSFRLLQFLSFECARLLSPCVHFQLWVPVSACLRTLLREIARACFNGFPRNEGRAQKGSGDNCGPRSLPAFFGRVAKRAE